MSLKISLLWSNYLSVLLKVNLGNTENGSLLSLCTLQTMASTPFPLMLAENSSWF